MRFPKLTMLLLAFFYLSCNVEKKAEQKANYFFDTHRAVAG
jgi:hypothetical protein